MDYSSSIHDPEHPGGASPWDTSPVASPQRNRSGLGPGTLEAPGSPTPYGQTPSTNPRYSQDSLGGGFNGAVGGIGSNSEVEESHRPDTAESVQSQPGQQQTGSPQGPLEQRQGLQTQQATEQHPKQPVPQGPSYKLQAKITGLERSGRKDPILRFDVHVGSDLLNVSSVQC